MCVRVKRKQRVKRFKRSRYSLRRNTDMGLRTEYASALSCNNRMLKICQDAQDACVMHVVAKSAKKGRRDAEAAEVAET